MMNFDKLKDPQIQAKFREAKTPDELLELAREQGFELSDEQLQAIAGGMQWRCTDQSCGAYYLRPADMPV